MKVLVTPRSFGKNNPELFEKLERAGLEVIRNETGAILDEETMKKLIEPCVGVVLGVDPLNASVLAEARNLRAVSKYGVGLDNIDLKECERRGIRVSRTVGANSDAVADYAFALMLGVARRLVDIDRRCHERDWGKVIGLDVYGKTLGLIGLGMIGKRVALRARGFEMRVLAYDPRWDARYAEEMGITYADVDRICLEADFISLHCLLNDETRNILNAERIFSLKRSAIIVNTARGELIDEDALLKALEEKRIFGAGIDVFRDEPPKNPAWYKLDNLIMGSHCSSSTAGAAEMMGLMATDNLLYDLDLRP